MSPSSGVTGILFIIFLTGAAFVMFWFGDASKYANKNSLDFGRKGWLAAECIITSEKDDSLQEFARAYFYQGNARIDLTTNRPGRISGHEILTSNGILYAWQDGQSAGVRVKFDPKKNIRSNVIEKAWWRCEPWWSPDMSIFTPPRAVRFVEP